MFEEIKEQLPAKNALLNAIKSEKINHCYIFCGSDGTGRFPLAMKFSQALLCEKKTACNECTACKLFLHQSSSDFKIVAPLKDGTKEKKDITIDQIREVVTDIYIKPYNFDKKIIIIKSADKMNINAQNALLKALEEPPEYVVFFLLIENTQNILPTILSRGNQIRFSALSDKAIKEIMSEKYDILIPDSLLPLCSGSAKYAHDIAVSEEYKAIRSQIMEAFYDFLLKKTPQKQLLLYSLMTKYENEKDFILNVMCTVASDVAHSQMGVQVKNTDFSYNDSHIMNSEKIYDVLNIISELSLRLKTNVMYNLSVFSALDEMRRIIE